MTGLPAGVAVAVEFVSGTWTDVTADVESYTYSVGRSSPFSAPQPSVLTVVLDNISGRYTPGRQMQSDGVTVNPNYPNVTTGKRVRVTWTAGTRYIGFATRWAPILDNGVTPRVTLAAIDRSDSWGRVTLDTPIAQEVRYAATPAYYWPCTDDSSAVTANDEIQNKDLVRVGTGPAPVFGSNGPGSGDGGGVAFAPSSATVGQFLEIAGLPPMKIGTIELWVNPGTSLPAWAVTNNAVNVAGWDDANGNCQGVFSIDQNGIPSVQTNASTGIFGGGGPTSILDGQWHLFTMTDDGSTLTFYVDGNFAFNMADTQAAKATLYSIGDAGGPFMSGSRFRGNLGQFVVYPTALTSMQVGAHFNAGRGFVGETVDARIARWLQYAGTPALEISLDQSAVKLNSHDQGGRTVAELVQQLVQDTESGGAALYVTEGLSWFRNRSFRASQTTPTLTIDIPSDGTIDGVQPSLDTDALVNQVRVTRHAASGDLATTVSNDPVSIAANQLRPGSDMTSYAQDNRDRGNVGAWVVAEQSQPSIRFPKIDVDVFTSATSTLLTQLNAVELGSRVRVTGIEPRVYPTTQADGIVEGYTETARIGQCVVSFDLSPADTPAYGVFDDSGRTRWQLDSTTLSGAISAAAGSIVVATSGQPLDTAAGSYPLDIQIDAEVLTVTTAPASGTSPQTLTVLRGQKGTTAAPHANNAAVSIYPLVTWGL